MEKLLVFNWKMNPETLEEALVLAKSSDYENAVVAPPFVFIEEAGKLLKKAGLAAQDVFDKPISKGAFTGEISASELKNLGVGYVIVGHSERRKLGDTDEIVAKKMKVVAENGLIPILCVGETKEERDQGKKEEAIKKQLSIVFSKLPITNYQLPIIVAYEPVWAIGTGEPESSESAIETIKYIKKVLVASRYPLAAKLLYGGSVDSQNLKNYLKYKEIGGALVGSAGLKKEEIKKMILCLN